MISEKCPRTVVKFEYGNSIYGSFKGKADFKYDGIVIPVD
jgi:hypothetical protein